MGARTGLETAIASVVRCVRCGALGVGTCLCWDYREIVMLRCPVCRRTQFAEREEGDMPDVNNVVELQCPDCYEATEPNSDPMKETP